VQLGTADSTAFADGESLETHAYVNEATGDVLELKSKLGSLGDAQRMSVASSLGNLIRWATGDGPPGQ
jgi:hypothetical protein